MFKNHPKSLPILFFTEIWERFSFYGMRALLVLYMTKALAFSDENAFAVFYAYGAMVYGTPVIGGFLADRFLGQRNAIKLGALLMTLGHFAMAFSGPVMFYTALGLLVVGNGFFKPNMSPLLGKFYSENDPRRDGAFTIFYMGVNIGALLAPMICSPLADSFGWHYGFAAAGVGMLYGLFFFSRNEHKFNDLGLPPEGARRPVFAGLNSIHLTWMGGFLVVPLFALLMNANDVLSNGLRAVGGLVLLYIIYTAYRSERVEGQRLAVATILICFSMLFWSFFFQGGGSLTLFADRNVDRHIGLFGMDITLSAALLEFVNPMFILLFSLPFAWMWERLAEIKREPSTPLKFAIATFLMGLGFAVFSLGSWFADENGLVPLSFLFLGWAVITAGELSISPVGLSMITKLSPPRIVSFMMGVWFLSSAFAYDLAKEIANLTAAPDTGAVEALSGTASLDIYTGVFDMVFWICSGAAVLMLLLVRPLRRWMHGIH